MTLGRPGALDPALDRFLQEARASWDWQQRVEIIGMRGQFTAGGDVTIRFRASRATSYVQVHVQTDAAGEGGDTYDPVNFLSSERVSCLEARQQDYVIERDGVKHFYVWLIPVSLDGDGTTFVKYDGADSADDYAAFADLGA